MSYAAPCFVLWGNEEEEEEDEEAPPTRPPVSPPVLPGRSEGDSNRAVTWLEMSPVTLQPSYVFERQLGLPAHCSAHWMVVEVEQAAAVLLDLRL